MFIYLSPFFFLLHTAYIQFYALRNILPGAIYCCLHTCCVYVVLSEVCYVCTPTFIARIANKYGPVIGILKRDCLRLFVVVYKLVMLMLCCW